MTSTPTPTAWRIDRKVYGLIASLIFLVAAAWLTVHGMRIIGFAESNAFSGLWLVVFASLVWHVVLAWTEKTYTTTAHQQAYLDSLKVTVNVPVHNEDPEALQRGLLALLRQTRLPQVIHVVENGKRNGDLDGIKSWFLGLQEEYAPRGLTLLWEHIPQAGKRGAQLHTLRKDGSDIFVTMDSDTVADPKAIEEGLKPFADPQVKSVASVILAYNAEASLVRLTDAWLLSFQLAVRAAMSRLGCVLVNSGNFALYRTPIIKDAMPSYESEYFRGNKVEFSDDSLLTLFAHLQGKTVQQPTSFAFTVLPESISHHLRQQLRWMRGSTIRSIWRFRYLPINGWAYWEHFWAWVNFVLITAVFAYLVLLAPFTSDLKTLPLMAGFAVLVAYMVGVRYLTIRRSDQTFKSQFCSWLLTPVMLAWTAFVLRSLRIYAICTCWRTG